MGMIGDLLYPDNADLARAANAVQERLLQTNALQNDLVNVYRGLAEMIRTFDAYLMAILVMQYQMVYAAEDLENLPDVHLPRLTESLADDLESLALDAVTVNAGLSGLRAIGNRIANIVSESGTYSGSIAEGSQSVARALGPELESVAARAPMVQSGTVRVLTITDLDATQLAELSNELKPPAAEMDAVGETSEVASQSGELGQIAESASTSAEVVSETVEVAEAASEAAAEAGVSAGATAAAEGGAAILGPAALVIIVVTEIISAIEAGEQHEKLEQALAKLQTLQKQADTSLATLRKAFKALLQVARVDLQTYNRVLAKLLALEKNDIYNQSFETKGIDAFLAALDGITITNQGGLEGYKNAVSADLLPATNTIRMQAQHDSVMASTIGLMKSHMRANKMTTVDDAYLASIAEVEGIELATVQRYNTFRIYLAQFAAVLKPFHEQLRAQPSLSVAAPSFGKPDPSFDPQPLDFALPSGLRA